MKIDTWRTAWTMLINNSDADSLNGMFCLMGGDTIGLFISHMTIFTFAKKMKKSPTNLDDFWLSLSKDDQNKLLKQAQKAKETSSHVTIQIIDETIKAFKEAFASEE